MPATIDHTTAWPLCPACGCPESVPLGTLGSLSWVRCRACGLDHAESVPATTTPDLEA